MKISSLTENDLLENKIRPESWSDKEYFGVLNFDYRHNGCFWYYQGKYIDFLERIDNEFARQHIDWIESDIGNGFEIFYCNEIYMQKNIGKPYINEIGLNYLSLVFENYQNEDLMTAINKLYIDMNNYFNLYIDCSVFIHTHIDTLRKYYDVRIVSFVQSLFYNNISIIDEQEKFLKILLNDKLQSFDFKKYISSKLTDEKIYEYYHLISEMNGMDTVYLQNYLHYSPSLQNKLCHIFLEGFYYREVLSEKCFQVFTRPIDENYQWTFVLHSSGGMIWAMCPVLMLITKTSQCKKIKPKDVIYQEHNLFFNAWQRTLFLLSVRDNFDAQCYSYVFLNRHINRYIDYMQDKIMAVIYDT